jgi:hypothetical protein
VTCKKGETYLHLADDNLQTKFCLEFMIVLFISPAPIVTILERLYNNQPFDQPV